MTRLLGANCSLRCFLFGTTKTAWFDGGSAATYIDWDMERKSKEPLEVESWDYKDDASFWRGFRHRIADEVRTVF